MNEQPVTVPDPYQMPTQPSPSGKSRLGLWIGLGVGGALLLAGIIVGVVLLLMSGSPKSIASAYLSAIEKDDQTKIRELSGESPDSLTNRAREEMKASKGFTYDGEKDDKDKGMVVRFKAGEDKKTIIAVTVKDRRITKLVINTGEPAKADDEKKADTDTQDAAKLSSCVTEADLKTARISINDDAFRYARDGMYSFMEFYFLPDSSEYKFPSVVSNDLDKIATFYTSNASKGVKLVLEGRTREATQSEAGKQLGIARANKVKADLVARGIPVSTLTVNPPRHSADSASEDMERTVDVKIVVDPACRR